MMRKNAALAFSFVLLLQAAIGLPTSAYDDLQDVRVASGTHRELLTTSGCVVNGLVKSAQKISNLYGNFPLSLSGGFGFSGSTLGDLDGDGVVDAVVGAYEDSDGYYRAGAVYILFLTTDGLTKSAQKISMSYGGFSSFYTLDSDDRFGDSSSTLGDVDGDGVVDIVVGAYGDSDGGYGAGAVYILFLTTDGLTKSAQKISNSHGDLSSFYTLQSSGGYDNFGRACSDLGDLDGDGVVDMVVGAEMDSNGASAAGSVYILFLTTAGMTKSAQKISNSYGGLSAFYTIAASDYFGSSSATLGDLDGDGVVDLVVGAMYDDDGGTNAGAVYILFLTSDGLTKSAQKISNSYGNLMSFYSLASSNSFGMSSGALGDMDGDGVVDMVVGTHESGDGAVFILFLTTAGLINSAQKISNSEGNLSPFYSTSSDLFGVSSAYIGDLDGDGVGEIMVGAYEDDDAGSDVGAVYILFMDAACPSPAPTTPAPTLTSNPTLLPTVTPVPTNTVSPTPVPSTSVYPSPSPTSAPTGLPSALPSRSPTLVPIPNPSPAPSVSDLPTPAPTSTPAPSSPPTPTPTTPSPSSSSPSEPPTPGPTAPDECMTEYDVDGAPPTRKDFDLQRVKPKKIQSSCKDAVFAALKTKYGIMN